ncbi:MAG TPA: hypothetical protein VH143_13640 [Kofleriaceae bacterium]|nr:hypothetical protein [Kofleriaceae bacterium]
MLHELVDRFTVDHARDIGRYVAKNPLVAVGAAVAIGVIVARGGKLSRTMRHELFDVVLAVAGTLAMNVAKDAAVHAARDWAERRDFLH